MSDFSSLEPHARMCASIGEFLHRWSFVEHRVNTCIGTALNLDTVQSVILSRQLQFRNKIHLLRTLISISPKMTPKLVEHFDKALNEIAEYSLIRNMVAHDMFYLADKNVGVDFFKIQASGKLKIPPTTWLWIDFFKHNLELYGFRDWLDTIQKSLEPIKQPSLLGLLDYLNHLPPDDQSSDPATLGKIFGTPPDDGEPSPPPQNAPSEPQK